jgi:hypothetical protein
MNTKEAALPFRWIDYLSIKFPSERPFQIDARCIDDCPKSFYYFAGESGLNSSFGENRVFLQLPTHNPRLIKVWLAKAYREAQKKGCSVWVFAPRFIPSNSYYNQYTLKAKRLIFVSGRITLEGMSNKLASCSVFMEFDGKSLGGPSVYNISVSEMLEVTRDIKPGAALNFELKKRAMIGDYESLSKAVKPIKINRDELSTNEAIYKLEKQGQAAFIQKDEMKKLRAGKKNFSTSPILDEVEEEDLID